MNINPIITNNKSLNEFIINRCNKDINEYNISLTSILKNLEKYYYYQNMFFFIIYKDNKLISLFNNGDNRKNKIFEIVKRNIKNLKNLPNFFIPFYVSDTHFYQNNDIPFFVEAKPGNKKGILYPDQNYYYISIENNDFTYDEFKDILKKHKCSNQKDKKDIIYFSGGNTGADKHNIRMKLNEIVNDEENNTIKNNYDININTQFVPMYDFCKFKYLLNLPGHQPWSYRMTKILLMNSLIFDVSILQTYIDDKNEKWVQFYSDYFKPGEDYIEIKYYWTESLTSDMEVYNIYNELNKLHKYYNENNEEYKKITYSATKKANELNNEIFDKTFQYLIELFIQKTYKDNDAKQINKFIDDLISLDKNYKVYNLIKDIKKNDMYIFHNTNMFQLKSILEDGYLKSYSLLKKKPKNGEGNGLYNKNNFVYFSCTDKLFDKNIMSYITLYFNSKLLYNKSFYVSTQHSPEPNKLGEWYVKNKGKKIKMYKIKYNRYYKNYNSVLKKLYKKSISISNKYFQVFQQIAIKNKVNLNELVAIEFKKNTIIPNNIKKYISKYYPNIIIKYN